MDPLCFTVILLSHNRLHFHEKNGPNLVKIWKHGHNIFKRSTDVIIESGALLGDFWNIIKLSTRTLISSFNFNWIAVLTYWILTYLYTYTEHLKCTKNNIIREFHWVLSQSGFEIQTLNCHNSVIFLWSSFLAWFAHTSQNFQLKVLKC